MTRGSAPRDVPHCRRDVTRDHEAGWNICIHMHISMYIYMYIFICIFTHICISYYVYSVCIVYHIYSVCARGPIRARQIAAEVSLFSSHRDGLFCLLLSFFFCIFFMSLKPLEKWSSLLSSLSLSLSFSHFLSPSFSLAISIFVSLLILSLSHIPTTHRSPWTICFVFCQPRVSCRDEDASMPSVTNYRAFSARKKRTRTCTKNRVFWIRT